MKNLIDAVSPDYLLVADKPLSQVAVEIRKLSTQEIKSELHFEYNENIRIDDHYTLGDDDETNEIHFPAVRNRLDNALNDSLILCPISDEVGYGVFTRAPIEVGTIIGLYAGCLDTKSGGDYGMAIGNSGRRINAEKSGGITRFIQHMPSDVDKIMDDIDSAMPSDFFKLAFSHGRDYDDHKAAIYADPHFFLCAKKGLKDSILNDNVRANDEMKTKPFLKKTGLSIATANTGFVVFAYKGTYIGCIIATRPIAIHEQLGISYGLDYWVQKRKIPRYFDKNGLLVPLTHYLPELNSILAKYKAETEQELPNKELALRRAVFLNSVNDVHYLLEYGADVNAKSPTGKTALSNLGGNSALPKTKANLIDQQLIQETLVARGARIFSIGQSLRAHSVIYQSNARNASSNEPLVAENSSTMNNQK